MLLALKNVNPVLTLTFTCMKKQSILLSIVFVGILLAMGCSSAKSGSSAQTQAAYDESLLLGTWLHSHEEDGKDPRGTIYRNAKYFTFPMARGREGFTFSTESKCMFLAIAPTDGTEEQPGKYGWGGKGMLKITLENGRSFNLKVHELSKDKMVVKEQ